MKRSALLLVSAVVGMLAIAGPASAAAPTYYRTYPSHDLAAKACDAGKQQGRWSSCTYRPAETGPNPPVELWVA